MIRRILDWFRGARMPENTGQGRTDILSTAVAVAGICLVVLLVFRWLVPA